ncbi:MAG TPA: hypothetical protein PLV09_02715 [Candidatus Omnitrophota bacterium]|nr:hypothetical protein [Candidatus Omnitrophota bacterium]MDD5269995.1 hypothetical protein [Candidatus Omnitrophota bacterium]MDD5737934.1 hypothetical protein [Candidatus Omnitrophota bacterium]HOX09690.1 hypothetical protein [Candidatus Omnitrophota bacterium]HPN66309.1 hypothetical protein [Candidatus Omnitrophota bacterium]
MKEFFARMSPREKAGMAIAAVVVLVVFVDRLIVNPMAVRMHRLNTEIKAGENALRLDTGLAGQKGAVSAEYGKYSAYVRKSGSDEEEQTKMFSEIEELERKSGVSPLNMKAIAPRAVDFYRKYEVELEVEGEMEQIVNFLYLLNNSPQLLRAEKVTLNPRDRDSAAVRAKMNVTKVVMP